MLVQTTVDRHKTDHRLIDDFFCSMEMDLQIQRHDRISYARYIHGSAEVVGLMCLKVFCKEDNPRYKILHPYAVALGAAFQKTNFLRDIGSDYTERDRVCFPNTEIHHFTDRKKQQIEDEITKDFLTARKGIAKLPRGSLLGVYVAYVYFYNLLRRIRKLSASDVLKLLPQLSNTHKLWLMIECYFYLRTKRI